MYALIGLSNTSMPWYLSTSTGTHLSLFVSHLAAILGALAAVRAALASLFTHAAAAKRC